MIEDEGEVVSVADWRLLDQSTERITVTTVLIDTLFPNNTINNHKSEVYYSLHFEQKQNLHHLLHYLTYSSPQTIRRKCISPTTPSRDISDSTGLLRARKCGRSDSLRIKTHTEARVDIVTVASDEKAVDFYRKVGLWI